MANEKISDLAEVTIPASADPIPIVNSSTTKKVTVSNLLSLLSTYKNLVINGNPLINQREYVSAAATSGANEYTLDRWRVVTSGQALTFSTTENVVTMTLPVGGIEQVIEGLNIQSGTHIIRFVATGDTVCTVDAVTKASGDTFTLTGGTNATLKFSSALGTGTVKLIQIELGAVVTAFENRSICLELMLCTPYYQVLGYGLPGAWVDASTVDLWTVFPVEMRASPTPILLDTTPVVTEFNVADRTGTASSIIASTLDKRGARRIRIDGFSGATVGAIANSSSVDMLGLEAEIA